MSPAAGFQSSGCDRRAQDRSAGLGCERLIVDVLIHVPVSTQRFACDQTLLVLLTDLLLRIEEARDSLDHAGIRHLVKDHITITIAGSGFGVKNSASGQEVINRRQRSTRSTHDVRRVVLHVLSDAIVHRVSQGSDFRTKNALAELIHRQQQIRGDELRIDVGLVRESRRDRRFNEVLNTQGRASRNGEASGLAKVDRVANLCAINAELVIVFTIDLIGQNHFVLKDHQRFVRDVRNVK